MKYSMKAHSINYERGNEKCTALIMKEAMNKCNLINEISIEIAQH